MKIKATLKAIARFIALLPGVSRLLRIPAVRKSLLRLPAVSRLFADIAEASPWDRTHPFNTAHGAGTNGFVAVARLDQIESEAARVHALPYGGSQPSIVRVTLFPLNSLAFVDLGCGKGRPLLVASVRIFVSRHHRRRAIGASPHDRPAKC